MTTFVVIRKEEVNRRPALKAQLQSLAEQMQEVNGEYSFLPVSGYMDIFMKTLEKEKVAYRKLSPASR